MFRRFERRKHRQGGGEWLTIYSDLMTNLMLFFLMLFALTRLDADAKDKVYRSIKKDFTTIQEKKDFNEVLKIEKKAEDEMSRLANELSEIDSSAKISINEQYIKMMLPDPVLFGLGRDQLKEDGKRVLDQLVEILMPLPHEIVIEGHTDDQPIREGGKYLSNWELSQFRAISAVEYFISKGIDSKRLAAVAYGPYHPMVSNDTDENRKKNRRIEINIVRER